MKCAHIADKRPRHRVGLRSLLTILTLIAVAVAIRDQLKRPSAERTWHGQVFGFVPYDFRVPTIPKLLRSFWDPNNRNVVSGKTFGVGWDLNVAALVKRFGLPRAA